MNHRFARTIPFDIEGLLANLDNVFTSSSPTKSTELPVNVRVTDTALEFHVFVPGITKEDKAVALTVENGFLVIAFTAPQKDTDAEQKDWVTVEHQQGDAKRSFRLPKDVDVAHIKGRLRDGVLVVTVPKIVPAPAQSIVIDED